MYNPRASVLVILIVAPLSLLSYLLYSTSSAFFQIVRVFNLLLIGVSPAFMYQT